MSKYPIPKKKVKSKDKFVSKKGEFEIYKDDKKLSDDKILKLLNDKKVGN